MNEGSGAKPLSIIVVVAHYFIIKSPSLEAKISYLAGIVGGGGGGGGGGIDNSSFVANMNCIFLRGQSYFSTRTTRVKTLHDLYYSTVYLFSYVDEEYIFTY